MASGTIIEGEVVPVTHLSLGAVLNIPAVRQIMLLIGVAGSVAAGFAAVLWLQAPGFSRLYDGLDSTDISEVADALRAADIDFELNMDTGTVLVPESRMHDARLELATQALPRGVAVGMKSLQEQSTFGQSQFRENALYQHALEGELARTISHLGAVHDARVHLALPRQSAFLRDHESASASVMLNLYRGRELESDQVASIVHLVASSVPNLVTSNVTIIDQQGRLLSSGEDQWTDALTTKQFELAERLERGYKRRIEALLTPLLGPGRVRAEVVADVDFTISEEARESFDPSGRALVSEHVSQNQRTAGDPAQGIPGALSNQPPESGGAGADGVTRGQADATTVNSSSSSTRNYELDRTVSHTRPQTGTIRRLSVAVLVDDTPVDTGDDTAPRSLAEADIERITSLVKEAVGFDEERGDTVVVVKAAFQRAPEATPMEEPKFWAQPFFKDTLRQILGAAVVLALAFGLVRPLLRSLLATNAVSAVHRVGSAGGSSYIPVSIGQSQGNNPAIAAPSYDEKVAAAKNISNHDPAKVAQVVKQWVGAEEG